MTTEGVGGSSLNEITEGIGGSSPADDSNSIFLDSYYSESSSNDEASIQSDVGILATYKLAILNIN